LSVDAAASRSDEETPVKRLSSVAYNDNQMADLQQKDPDLGPILGWKLSQAERPAIEHLLSTSEASKMLWSQWDQLELHDGVLYRRKIVPSGRDDVLQLLVPACLRSAYLEQAHTGITGGHLRVQRTMGQVRRRAFWFGWRR